MRAGHTDAGCDVAAMAGLTPAAVICEIMNDDGTMARLPDLERFAREHGLKIGTIADLIHHRSHNESLIEPLGTRDIETAQGRFQCTAFRDLSSGGLHLALTVGQWSADDEVPVRVHEPLSVITRSQLIPRAAYRSWSARNASTSASGSTEPIIVFSMAS